MPCLHAVDRIPACIMHSQKALKHRMQMHYNWSMNRNTENHSTWTQIRIHPGHLLLLSGNTAQATVDADLKRRLCFSDVKQEQMHVKKKKCVLADLERAGYPLGKHLGCYIVCSKKQRILSSHPAYDFCQSYTTLLPRKPKLYFKNPYKTIQIKEFFPYIFSFLGFIQLYSVENIHQSNVDLLWL